MRRKVGLIVALISCLCSGGALANDCFSLNISLPSGSFRETDRLPLTFTLKNCGNDTVTRQYYGGKIRGYTDYFVSIQGNDNLDLKKTSDYGEGLRHENLTRVMTHDIPPGQAMTSIGDLRNMFQISRPGNYRLVVTTKVPDSLTGPHEVQSNEVTFSIVDSH